MNASIKEEGNDRIMTMASMQIRQDQWDQGPIVERKTVAWNYTLLVWSSMIGWKLLSSQSERLKSSYAGNFVYRFGPWLSNFLKIPWWTAFLKEWSNFGGGYFEGVTSK